MRLRVPLEPRMTRYLSPPTPGPECDTAQAVREFYEDVALAADIEDARWPDPRDEMDP